MCRLCSDLLVLTNVSKYVLILVRNYYDLQGWATILLGFARIGYDLLGLVMIARICVGCVRICLDF